VANIGCHLQHRQPGSMVVGAPDCGSIGNPTGFCIVIRISSTQTIQLRWLTFGSLFNHSTLI
jgi:hypothetical protein